MLLLGQVGVPGLHSLLQMSNIFKRSSPARRQDYSWHEVFSSHLAPIGRSTEFFVVFEISMTLALMSIRKY
jgi:hypothetical protein